MVSPAFIRQHRAALLAVLTVALLLAMLQLRPLPAFAVSGPEVTAYGPAPDSVQASVYGNLTLTFDQPVSAEPGKTIRIKTAVNDTLVETINVGGPSVVVEGNTVTVDPVYDLLYSTQYYVEIDSGAFKNDLSLPFAGISDNTTWRFTTELRSEVTANDSTAFNLYWNNPLISVLNLVSGRTYDYPGGTVSRVLQINGNGATIRGGAGVADTVVRRDDVIITSPVITNYASTTLMVVSGAGAHLKLNNLVLQNGNYAIFAILNVKTGASLTVDNITVKDFHNNFVPGENLSYGIHSEPGAISTTIRNSQFTSSNAFRNAVAIRSGAFEITGNTFQGTDYPQRLRQSDGYEYALYIYGGTGSITGNLIAGYDSTTQLGYSSGGISVIGYYPANVSILNNNLSYNESGIDITRTWGLYTSNTTMIVNGITVNSSEGAFEVGELLKKNNTQEYVAVSLDQGNVVNFTTANNQQYQAVMGGYRSPTLTVTSSTYSEAVLNIPAGQIDFLNGAASIGLERQVDDGPWQPVTPTWIGIPSDVTVSLEPGHANRFRSKLTHLTPVTPPDQPETLVTYSNLVSVESPGTPTLTGATAAVGSVQLAWNPVAGATGYKVYQSLSGGQYGTVAETVGASVYGTTLSGLTNGTTYYYSVRAVMGTVDSAYSNQLPATPIPDTPALTAATGGDGAVTLSWTPVAGATGYTVYQSQSSASTGTSVSTVSGSVYGTTISGLTNGTTYYFSVRASIGSTQSDYSAALSAMPRAAGLSGGGSAASSNPGVQVLVNGKAENAGTASTGTRNGQTVTTVTVDPKKLEERLTAEGKGAVITIPVKTASDVVVGQLNGAMIRSMEQKQAVVEIQANGASYRLPAEQIDIGAVSSRLGTNVKLEDMQVQIEIAKPNGSAQGSLAQAAQAQEVALIGAPAEFKVTVTYGSQTVEISKFEAYVERTIELPEGVDPSRVTTGIALDADSTLRHVPTQVQQTNGRYYATINSLTNSTYSVIWNPQTFGDMVGHWAQASVNDMGSRLIVNGQEKGKFVPDATVTRAEFAAILVRGLGLRPDAAASGYSDVHAGDWYAGAVAAAQAYKLIDGFEDGTFRPQEPITREQAMVILGRAMKVTGLAAKLTGAAGAAQAVQRYEDAGSISSWAYEGVANSLLSGLVSGRTDTALAVKAWITRAETAALIQRLLQKSDLI